MMNVKTSHMKENHIFPLSIWNSQEQGSGFQIIWSKKLEKITQECIKGNHLLVNGAFKMMTNIQFWSPQPIRNIMSTRLVLVFLIRSKKSFEQL